MTGSDDLRYFQRRQAQERAWADRARDERAGRVHEELAERYGALAREAAPQG